jgi:hypothetical protein
MRQVFGWFIWLMVAAMGLLAIGTVPALYAATAVAGISYGALGPRLVESAIGDGV